MPGGGGVTTVLPVLFGLTVLAAVFAAPVIARRLRDRHAADAPEGPGGPQDEAGAERGNYVRVAGSAKDRR